MEGQHSAAFDCSIDPTSNWRAVRRAWYRLYDITFGILRASCFPRTARAQQQTAPRAKWRRLYPWAFNTWMARYSVNIVTWLPRYSYIPCAHVNLRRVYLHTAQTTILWNRYAWVVYLRFYPSWHCRGWLKSDLRQFGAKMCQVPKFVLNGSVMLNNCSLLCSNYPYLSSCQDQPQI